MGSRRTARVAEAIREVVSQAILFELKDPRVRNVTVTSVEVSPDLRYARVFVSVRDEPSRQTLCLRGLESARGFLQAKVAERVQLRYTPLLRFVLDQGVKRSAEASRILRSVLPQQESDDNEPHAGEATADSPTDESDRD